MAFDDDNVYFAFRCWDSQPERRVATDMRRDVNNFINGNDILNVFIDTFHDRRNGVSFTVNALGARNDGQQIGAQYNGDWNPIWDTRGRHSSRAAGPWRWRCPSDRCATGRAGRRSGA